MFAARSFGLGSLVKESTISLGKFAAVWHDICVLTTGTRAPEWAVEAAKGKVPNSDKRRYFPDASSECVPDLCPWSSTKKGCLKRSNGNCALCPPVFFNPAYFGTRLQETERTIPSAWALSILTLVTYRGRYTARRGCRQLQGGPAKTQ